MTKRILVTGASGFIGTHLVGALGKRGFEVLTHSSRDGDIAECPLEYAGVSHVFHLAGCSFVPEGWDNALLFYRTNVLGTVNVLEFCRRNRASATLLSSYVYGQPKWLPIGEDHPVQAFNPYSHTKILAENVGQYYQRQFDIRVSIVRAFNVYGPGQRRHFLIPFLLHQALDPQLEFISLADLRPRRDFLNVRDLVELLCRLADSGKSGTYNAGSGSSFNPAEIADMIWALGVPSKPLKSNNQPRPDEVMEVVADASKARRELGWAPTISLSEGLAEMIAISSPGNAP